MTEQQQQQESAASAESFFSQLISDVLKATERISDDLDQAIATMFASSSSSSSSTTAGESHNNNKQNHQDEFADMKEELRSQVPPDHPLSGVAEEVLNQAMEGSRNNGPVGVKENIKAFRHAVDWTEPFIMGLVAFQIIILVASILVSRKNQALTPRVVVMLVIGVTVRCAELLNGWGQVHWKSFATQNYFDKRGVFVSIMLSAPLLLDSLIMLFAFMREASQLLILVKRKQITDERRKIKDQKRNKKDK